VPLNWNFPAILGPENRKQVNDFYSGRRPHASLDGNTPDQAYFNPLPIRMAA
jgi:hypothetical protein